MTDSSQATPDPLNKREGRCPACGQPIQELIEGCCALCGHRIEQPDVTSIDKTPYAQGRENNKRAWLDMCQWVYRAGKNRLAHLALSRPSNASLRFSRINILLFTVAVGWFVFTNTGWHSVMSGPAATGKSAEPCGKGWIPLFDQTSSSTLNASSGVRVTELWWNPALAICNSLAATIVAIIICFVLLGILIRGSRKKLNEESGGIHRIQCAIQYSTAWMQFLVLAVFIGSFREATVIFKALGWSATSTAIFDVPAVLVGITGLLMWWFWLIRLGDTSPRDVRSRTNRFFIINVPIWTFLLAGGAIYGFWFSMPHLAAILGLTW